MKIDPIQNGVVIDHITAGKGMLLYELLHLESLDVSIALIKNVTSKRVGKKDIIKIDADINVDLDIIGYVDPGATINYIKDGNLVKKCKLDLPEQLVGVLKCKNPRCITSTEQELKHVFKLTDKAQKVYRCIYCEAKSE